VQAWRQAHPESRHRDGKKVTALQEDSRTQGVEIKGESELFARTVLQDDFVSQPAVLIGLIAHITDSALQEDIARSTRRLLQLGQDILSGRAKNGYQASDLRRSGSPGAHPV
jgi:hypothetical protein